MVSQDALTLAEALTMPIKTLRLDDEDFGSDFVCLGQIDSPWPYHLLHENHPECLMHLEALEAQWEADHSYAEAYRGDVRFTYDRGVMP